MNKPPLILIVDDDFLDTKVLLRSFSDTNFICRTHITRNGKEALEYLNNTGNEKPWLIFTDINMPIMDGVEFLKERMKYKDFRSIPTIVFTTSSQDKESCFKLGISGYMVKPINYSEFKEIVISIKNYWLMSKSVTHN